MSADPGRDDRDGVAQDGTQRCAMVGHASGDTAGPLPGVDPCSDDEVSLPPLSDIPDFFVPFPRRGGPLDPPARVEGLGGSWSLIRQPAACERGAPNRTVVTLKRGPSLPLSLQMHQALHTCMCVCVPYRQEPYGRDGVLPGRQAAPARRSGAAASATSGGEHTGDLARRNRTRGRGTRSSLSYQGSRESSWERSRSASDRGRLYIRPEELPGG